MRLSARLGSKKIFLKVDSQPQQEFGDGNNDPFPGFEDYLKLLGVPDDTIKEFSQKLKGKQVVVCNFASGIAVFS